MHVRTIGFRPDIHEPRLYTVCVLVSSGAYLEHCNALRTSDVEMGRAQQPHGFLEPCLNS